MNRSTLVGLAGVLILFAVIGMIWRWSHRDEPAKGKSPAPASQSKPPAEPLVSDPARRARPPEPVVQGRVSAGEKAARLDKIKRDYDEIRAKASADYAAAGAAFPGGLNAFLRQLALLEREKRADIAAVLTARELEDLEMSETTAGKLVERLLGTTNATMEQRRAVFQIQRAFDDRFALTLDTSVRGLLEREAARQQVQEQIRGVLGDALFGSWLSGEGEDYTRLVAFAARYGLSGTAPLEVWRVKNELTLRRLEIAGQQGMSALQLRAAQAALTQQTEARIISIVGPGALEAGRTGVLGWLPKK